MNSNLAESANFVISESSAEQDKDNAPDSTPKPLPSDRPLPRRASSPHRPVESPKELEVDILDRIALYLEKPDEDKLQKCAKSSIKEIATAEAIEHFNFLMKLIEKEKIAFARVTKLEKMVAENQPIESFRPKAVFTIPQQFQEEFEGCHNTFPDLCEEFAMRLTREALSFWISILKAVRKQFDEAVVKKIDNGLSPCLEHRLANCTFLKNVDEKLAKALAPAYVDKFLKVFHNLMNGKFDREVGVRVETFKNPKKQAPTSKSKPKPQPEALARRPAPVQTQTPVPKTPQSEPKAPSTSAKGTDQGRRTPSPKGTRTPSPKGKSTPSPQGKSPTNKAMSPLVGKDSKNAKPARRKNPSAAQKEPEGHDAPSERRENSRPRTRATLKQKNQGAPGNASAVDRSAYQRK